MEGQRWRLVASHKVSALQNCPWLPRISFDKYGISLRCSASAISSAPGRNGLLLPARDLPAGLAEERVALRWRCLLLKSLHGSLLASSGPCPSAKPADASEAFCQTSHRALRLELHCFVSNTAAEHNISTLFSPSTPHSTRAGTWELFLRQSCVPKRVKFPAHLGLRCDSLPLCCLQQLMSTP